MKNAGNTIEE